MRCSDTIEVSEQRIFILRKDFNIMSKPNDDFYYEYGEDFYQPQQRRSLDGNSSRNRRRRKKKRGCAPFFISCMLLCAFAAGSFSFFSDFLYRHLPALPVDPPSSNQIQWEAPQNSSQNTDPEIVSEPEDWSLILVNRDNPLQEKYSVETTTLNNGEQVDTRIYPALQKMFDDMRADGIYPVVASGYRTEEDQQRIMEEKIQAYCAEGYSEKEAKKKAEEWVALPGTSEHQTGLAVDINADGIHSAGYEVYDWLLLHAHEYGFVKRYPEDKISITGISNEPWHYRYVGESAAKEMVEQNLCLEEYLK